MRCLWPLKRLADYNIAGPLNALLKSVQELDAENGLGKRNVMLSKNPPILEGFSLNRQTLFESVMRAPVGCSISIERELSHAHPQKVAIAPQVIIRDNVFLKKNKFL